MVSKIKNLSDNELYYLALENNEDASNILFNKYKYIVDIAINKYKRSAYALNLDMDELKQEAMVGYADAIRSYNEEKDIQLRTFIGVCVERRLQNFIRDNKTLKMKTLKEAYSLDNEIGEDLVLADIVGDNSKNPEYIKEQSENIKKLRNTINESLSPFEYQVFELLLNDYTTEDIAKILKTTTKNIYNTTYRMREKLRDLI